MQHNSYEIRVLVKGRPINEYPHNGQTFVEGRASSNFEIEFVNRTGARVEAVLSVDGLSVIDGKDAGPTSAGYLVDAWGSVKVPGWKLTDEQVAAFVFAGKGQSYAAQTTGTARNTGVIGALVFKEKVVSPFYGQYASHTLGGTLYNGHPTLGGVARGMSFGMVSPTTSAADLNNVMIGAALNNASYTSGGATASLSTAKSPGVSTTEVDHSVVQSLGTGFGEATEFATTTVSFNRGDLGAMLILYYDDSRGLRARGIELQRPSRHRVSPAAAPNAFPGMNCAPPPGWKG